jgi:endoglucanase Acf2
MQNGNVFSIEIDRGPWMLYDTRTEAAGATPATGYQFFANTDGVAGKHITNLVQANRVPPPTAFFVMSIGWYFGPSMLPADVINILNNYYFRFYIGGKDFAEGLLQFWPAGAGLTGWASTNSATAAVIQSVVNGTPSVNARRTFPDYPRTIPQNVNFGVELKLGASAATALVAQVASTAVSPAYGGMRLICALDGIYDRAVQ